MSGFRIENQDVNTFLTYEIKETDTIDSLSFGMLTNNKIKGVAPILFTQRDETKFLKYNISAKAQASQFFSGVVTKNRLLKVILGITASVMAAEEYMVDTSFFVFDLEHIYIDTSTYEPMMICLPVLGEERSQQSMQNFFKTLVFTARYDQTENCDYVAKLINYFNSTTVFSLSDFKKLLENLYNNGITVAAEKPPVVVHKPIEERPPIVEKKPEPEPVSYKPPVVTKPAEVYVNSGKPPVSPPPATPARGMGMDIPGGKIKTDEGKKKKGKEKPKDETKKMSALYLIRHYSKENLEIYKAQKAGKEESPKEKPRKVKTPQAPVVPSGFNIPGQPVSAPQAKNDIKIPPFNGGYSAADPGKIYSSARTENDKIPGRSEFSSTSADFGDTTVLIAPGAAGETSLLTADVTTAVKPRPYLVRLKNGEKILIDKPRFRIGKEKSYVDYFIGDNTAISRSHADIIVKGDEYYLVDLNSTNHTFVNGSMIQGNAEVQIKNGNRIKFANEEFDFVEEI